MDAQKVAELVGRKHRSDLDPSDPIVLVRSMFEKSNADALAQLSKVVAEAADKIAAAAAQADAAARAKAEATVTQAGEWAALRIKEAGEVAAARVLAEAQRAGSMSASVGQRLKWAVVASVACAVAALSASISTVVAIWFG